MGWDRHLGGCEEAGIWGGVLGYVLGNDLTGTDIWDAALGLVWDDVPGRVFERVQWHRYI